MNKLDFDNWKNPLKGWQKVLLVVYGALGALVVFFLLFILSVILYD